MQEKLLPPDEIPTKVCPECNGSGNDPSDRTPFNCPCPNCNGEGEIIEEDIRYSFDEIQNDDERSNNNE